MSSMSSDITSLVMEEFSPETNMPDMRPLLVQLRLRVCMISSHAYDHSMGLFTCDTQLYEYNINN